MGKDSKGNRLRDRFPLAVSFADFFGGKEIGPPEATGHGNELQRQRANPQRPGGLPAAAGIPLIRHGASVSRVVPLSPRRRQSLRRDESKTRDISLLRERPSFAARRKKAKARPGNHSIKVPRDPSSRPMGSAPLDPRRGFYEGREIGRGIWIAHTGRTRFADPYTEALFTLPGHTSLYCFSFNTFCPRRLAQPSQ